MAEFCLRCQQHVAWTGIGQACDERNCRYSTRPSIMLPGPDAPADLLESARLLPDAILCAFDRVIVDKPYTWPVPIRRAYVLTFPVSLLFRGAAAVVLLVLLLVAHIIDMLARIWRGERPC